LRLLFFQFPGTPRRSSFLHPHLTSSGSFLFFLTFLCWGGGGGRLPRRATTSAPSSGPRQLRGGSFFPLPRRATQSNRGLAFSLDVRFFYSRAAFPSVSTFCPLREAEPDRRFRDVSWSLFFLSNATDRASLRVSLFLGHDARGLFPLFFSRPSFFGTGGPVRSAPPFAPMTSFPPAVSRLRNNDDSPPAGTGAGFSFARRGLRRSATFPRAAVRGTFFFPSAAGPKRARCTTSPALSPLSECWTVRSVGIFPVSHGRAETGRTGKFDFAGSRESWLRCTPPLSRPFFCD